MKTEQPPKGVLRYFIELERIEEAELGIVKTQRRRAEAAKALGVK